MYLRVKLVVTNKNDQVKAIEVEQNSEKIHF